jgi:hypothetical protein
VAVLDDSPTTSAARRSSTVAISWLISRRLSSAKLATATAMAATLRGASGRPGSATVWYSATAGPSAAPYMPALNRILTGSRRSSAWASSSPARETSMAGPAGSRAVLATSMVSYSDSDSSAPWWRSRSPPSSDAVVRASRTASSPGSPPPRRPGSIATTAAVAAAPATTTMRMKRLSLGGSTAGEVPAVTRRAPGCGAAWTPARRWSRPGRYARARPPGGRGRRGGAPRCARPSGPGAPASLPAGVLAGGWRCGPRPPAPRWGVGGGTPATVTRCTG